jgi:hypothetical protein
MFVADVSTQLKNKNITADIKVDTNSNVSLIFIFRYYILLLGFVLFFLFHLL